jgi:hypothetical protein
MTARGFAVSGRTASGLRVRRRLTDVPARRLRLPALRVSTI